MTADLLKAAKVTFEMIDRRDLMKRLNRERYPELVKEYRDKEIDAHPMNGKLGWWRIEGIRHSAFAKASSAREAIDKSTDHVGTWEQATAEWIGEELPEVFS